MLETLDIARLSISSVPALAPVGLGFQAVLSQRRRKNESKR
jgi:hypothetical protein